MWHDVTSWTWWSDWTLIWLSDVGYFFASDAFPKPFKSTLSQAGDNEKSSWGVEKEREEERLGHFGLEAAVSWRFFMFVWSLMSTASAETKWCRRVTRGGADVAPESCCRSPSSSSFRCFSKVSTVYRRSDRKQAQEWQKERERERGAEICCVIFVNYWLIGIECIHASCIIRVELV